VLTYPERRRGVLRQMRLFMRWLLSLISLSIAYVAIENVLTCELKPWSVAIVFAFGLLHGMGFAGC
jgi:hypothetical protein